MIEGQTKPLEIARRLLEKGTLDEILGNPGYTLRAHLILDRWALNSPDQLKALEQRGISALMLKIADQQFTETQVLTSESAYRARSLDMSDWDILNENGVVTELSITG